MDEEHGESVDKSGRARYMLGRVVFAILPTGAYFTFKTTLEGRTSEQHRCGHLMRMELEEHSGANAEV
ncbi:hypothetical protein PAXRUDRAFT_821197 [Paxillus rubicundulus Ve08.2h10]|uniref:Uncharacterized protein n=1 Tax=Paxillus rubicundulus Ve08.2h10 TaxID=930991 RepID=A0A0D0E6V5_9AGAM|nr:hypothetical protein PAXRUDRAFT_821197 [Paxillus rubicundulus Ve08.2h10]